MVREYHWIQRVSRDTLENEIEAATKRKDEIRWYYFPKVSFEIIKTAIPPGYEQPMHSHCDLHEATLVLKGQVVVKEETEGKLSEAMLSENDLVVLDRGKKSFHTMKNLGQDYSYTLTFKFLGPDIKDPQLFRLDWHAK
jgi:quercetin dioxygenase-like cupin family protein